MTLTEIVTIVAAYFIGSIPTGVIVARLSGAQDPRRVGSGNIGATNVGRSVGKVAGIITLLGDCCKGAIPTAVALFLIPSVLVVSLVGFAAFMGHLFPVFLGFRGGKGVATALGIFVIISPVATLISALVFVLLLLLFRYVSLGSMVAAASMPVALAFLPGARSFTPLGAMLGVLIIIKHADNIRRLVAGKENRMGGRK